MLNYECNKRTAALSNSPVVKIKLSGVITGYSVYLDIKNVAL